MRDEADRILPEDLNAQLRDGRVVVIDMRQDQVWRGSDRKLPGAIRIAPDEMKGRAGELVPGKLVVTYCT